MVKNIKSKNSFIHCIVNKESRKDEILLLFLRGYLLTQIANRSTNSLCEIAQSNFNFRISSTLIGSNPIIERVSIALTQFLQCNADNHTNNISAMLDRSNFTVDNGFPGLIPFLLVRLPNQYAGNSKVEI